MKNLMCICAKHNLDAQMHSPPPPPPCELLEKWRFAIVHEYTFFDGPVAMVTFT